MLLKTLLKFVVSCLDILTASILYINIGTVLANSKESDKGNGDLVPILLKIELAPKNFALAGWWSQLTFFPAIIGIMD